jgi:hypothetical protein
MENFSWAGEPLQKFLDESPNPVDVTEVEKVLVQAFKCMKRAKLRL